MPQQRMIILGMSSLHAQLRTACLLEAAAGKPGNVHPGVSFEDLSFQDFEHAAEITATELSRVREVGVGQAILNTIREIRQQVGTNANLGIVLLLGPMAAVPETVPLVEGIGQVVSQLDMQETTLIYDAIRIAQPGAMGEVSDQDISQPPTEPIQYAMKLAAEDDSIAKQYVSGFDDVLTRARAIFLEWTEQTEDWETAVVGLHLDLLWQVPDTLIARKYGWEMAAEVGVRAKTVLEAGWPETLEGQEEFRRFDRWLRAEGNKRNPGATADLIAATLFALIRDKQWVPPKTIVV